MIKRLRGLLVMLCCVAGMAVAEEKNILVTSGSDRATPIAVVPFGLQGGSVLPEDMADIIGNDLRNSGYYSPIPRQNMISQPSQASEVIFRDWKALGAQYVMVGSIVPSGGRLQVQYALFNVATEQQVLTGSVAGSVDQLRDMAHYISDQSFEKLTGIKGAFSTRMLYVTAERFSTNNTRYTLQRSDYDGARAVTLLQSREPILSPRFAPDGKRIAYVSFEQKRPRIFVQHIDTGRREQVTNFEGLNGAPAWSPDGSRGVRAVEGRQPGHLRDERGFAPDQPCHRWPGHQHRAVLGQGWQHPVLHLRPWRQAADLQAVGRWRWRRACNVRG